MKEMGDGEVDAYVASDPSHFGIVAKPEGWHKRRYSFAVVKKYPLCLHINKSHPLAKKKKVSFAELKDEPFLMLGKRSYFQEIVREEATKYGFEPKVAFESADVIQLASLANSGKGVLIATDNPVTRRLFPDIRVIPFDDPSFNYSIAFVFQSRDSLKAQDRVFIDYVVRNAR